MKIFFEIKLLTSRGKFLRVNTSPPQKMMDLSEKVLS